MKRDFQVRVEEDGEDELVEVFDTRDAAKEYYEQAIAKAYCDVVNNSIHIELIEVLEQYSVDPPYVTEGE